MFMKLTRKFKTIVILMSVMSLVGCSNINSSKKNNEEDSVNKNSNGEVVLNLWSYTPGLEGVVDEFEKENPNIKVNIKMFEYEEYEEKYKESLMKKNGEADMFIIDSNEYGGFNSIKGLENMLKPEYTAINYKDDYDKELWELGKSINKKELLGLPIASAPLVTFYRADIMEKYGFPSEPHELAKYMSNEENWLNMARTLSKDNIYMLQWLTEIVKIKTSNMPFFNEKLEYERDNDKFKEGVSIARQARLDGLAAYSDIWAERGIKMLQEGKFAMFYLGSWGAAEIEALVPEQKGKWRVTSLPLGIYGWSNASILSIAENSNNKDAAWKFVEYYVFKYKNKKRQGNVSGYLPFRNNEENLSRENEFLGGQQDQKLYEEVMSMTKEYPVTPLDAATFRLIDDAVNKGLEDDSSDEKILQNIREELDSKLKKQKEILLEQMN